MNFIALLSSFHAIATKSYEKANPAVYDAIPENDKNIFDLMIKNARIMDGSGNQPFRADIAINYNSAGLGTITDVGDLEMFASKQTIDAGELILTPGFATVIDLEKSGISGLPELLENRFRQGYTTLLLKFSYKDFTEIAAVQEILDNRTIPANAGIIIHIDEQLSAAQDSLKVLKYIGKKGLGLIADREPRSGQSFAEYTRKPVLTEDTVSPVEAYDNITPGIVKAHTTDIYSAWKIRQRSPLKRGQIADLILFSKTSDAEVSVYSVLLKGHEIFHKGVRTNADIRGDDWY
jgi:hypothetical protein